MPNGPEVFISVRALNLGIHGNNKCNLSVSFRDRDLVKIDTGIMTATQSLSLLSRLMGLADQSTTMLPV
jgi:hypothetical protein